MYFALILSICHSIFCLKDFPFEYHLFKNILHHRVHVYLLIISLLFSEFKNTEKIKRKKRIKITEIIVKKYKMII